MIPTVKFEVRNPKSERIWNLLKDIPDPEIPIITIADLGILRDVEIRDDKVIVSITPTYSGCPAMKAISQDIIAKLKESGIEGVQIKTVFSPVWTTDWINDKAKEKLRAYGIAPPTSSVHCPRCNSSNVEKISQFGSTACKALYRCLDCQEPFDYFKCH